MSVLIKGLKMPKEYEFIDLVITGDGVVREYYEGKVDIEIAEAVELPDHGDLIDRDALCISGGRVNGKMFFAELLKNAPVVIPAERSEDGQT